MFIFEIILLLLFIVIDLLSKHYVSAMLNGGSKVIIPDILTFTYSENYGASFGILSGRPIIILSISITVCLALLGFLAVKRKTNRFMRFSLILIIAGAIGNIYDRLVFGFVRDFIDYTFLTTWFNINFAICNVADVFLTVGAVLLIIYVIFIYKEKPKTVTVKPSRKKRRRKKDLQEPVVEAAVETKDDKRIGLHSSNDFTVIDKDVVHPPVAKDIIPGPKIKKKKDEKIEISKDKEFQQEPVKEETKPKPKVKIEVVKDISFTDFETKEPDKTSKIIKKK